MELIEGMPVIFNASNKPLDKADSEFLYDFTVLRRYHGPSGNRERYRPHNRGIYTIRAVGLPGENYGGIYVYVPAEVLKGNKLTDEILTVEVIEAKVSSVVLKYYDANQEPRKGYLDANTLLGWSRSDRAR